MVALVVVLVVVLAVAARLVIWELAQVLKAALAPRLFERVQDLLDAPCGVSAQGQPFSDVAKQVWSSCDDSYSQNLLLCARHILVCVIWWDLVPSRPFQPRAPVVLVRLV